MKWPLKLILMAGGTVALFLYPFPSTNFLYRNAEVFKGRVSHLQGASIALGLDPSFYYKFKISPWDFDETVAALGLRKSQSRDYELWMMRRHGPLFWNSWWWRPGDGTGAMLYSGNREGNNYYFLYNPKTQVAYLYIQNT